MTCSVALVGRFRRSQRKTKRKDAPLAHIIILICIKYYYSTEKASDDGFSSSVSLPPLPTHEFLRRSSSRCRSRAHLRTTHRLSGPNRICLCCYRTLARAPTPFRTDMFSEQSYYRQKSSHLSSLLLRRGHSSAAQSSGANGVHKRRELDETVCLAAN